MKCEGESVPVRCEWGEGGLEVWVEGREEAVTITTDWSLGEPMMLADIDGKEVAVQVRSTQCSNKEHHSRNLVVADLNPIQCISSALFSSAVFIAYVANYVVRVSFKGGEGIGPLQPQFRLQYSICEFVDYYHALLHCPV